MGGLGKVFRSAKCFGWNPSDVPARIDGAELSVCKSLPHEWIVQSKVRSIPPKSDRFRRHKRGLYRNFESVLGQVNIPVSLSLLLVRASKSRGSPFLPF